MASQSTFYNWAFAIVIFSFVALAGVEIAKNMAVPYQGFTTENASPMHYMGGLKNLSVLEDMQDTSERAVNLLKPANQSESETGFFRQFFEKNVPVLVDISDFGIIVFQSVGATFKVLFEIFKFPKLLLDNIVSIVPVVPGYVVTTLTILIALAIVFAIVRVVTKKDDV